MRVLRLWLVAAIGLLLIVIVASVVYTRSRAQQYLLGLPGKLGVDIKQESDGFTYSQSVGGNTVFTVHAAKETQHTDGKITLHDVGIVLYGRKQDRADRIHGNEFEYDQASGIMRAIGEVYIDLAAPARPLTTDKTVAPAKTIMTGEQAAAIAVRDPQIIYVKTSGLIFHQKERSAATDQAIEFAAGGLTGKAVGATYDSANGLITLQSAVEVTGLRNGQPAHLQASHAVLDRPGNVLHLINARYVQTGKPGAESAAAGRAEVYLREGGQLDRIEADGVVTLGGERRETLVADRMKLQLNDDGQPRRGDLAGHVRFANDEAAKPARGTASEAVIDFDASGRPTRTLLTGGVELDQREVNSERRLLAATLLLGLSGGGKERVVLRSVEASGAAPTAGGRNAWLRLLDKTEQGMTTTDVVADTLTGRFAMQGTTSHVSGLGGRGRTSVARETVSPAGAVESNDKSTGDLLEAAFRANAKGHAELVRVTQSGHVETMRDATRKPDGKDKTGSTQEREQARSELLEYDAANDQVSLIGSVQIADAASSLSANRVVLSRKTGRSVAEGAVRVSYAAPGGQADPIHVTAARATANKATGVAEFFAGDGAAARMWQGGSQVEAPVLTFDRPAHRLVAHAVNGADQVRAVLVESSTAGTGGNQKNERTGVVRIASREMTYSDRTRSIEFAGKVHVNDASGSMQAEDAIVYLAPAGVAGTPAGPANPIMPSGKVERVIGQGAVELEQPGRRASGEKIVYTANDGTFLLTGTKTSPPRLSDAGRGTVTGASLRFRSGDDSVVVSGVEAGAENGRVRSETRIRQ